ncbi:MAG: bifunctional precorrin-2 dehydrogenase/sirohydrochlorin ferrochelatase [Thermoanaerobaculia bacterium]
MNASSTLKIRGRPVEQPAGGDAAARPEYYPVYLDLRDRRCIVVGGDAAAASKVEGLLAAGARVTVIAPGLEPALEARVASGAVHHLARGYRRGDLEGAFLALSVLADPEVNEPFWEEAETRGIPANVMDDVPRCSFIAPSIVRRGDLCVAVSTSGKAPALAVRIREWLERVLGPEHARFLELAGALREPLARARPDLAERRELWYRLVDSDVIDLLARGDESSAVARVEEIMGIRPDLGVGGEEA